MRKAIILPTFNDLDQTGAVYNTHLKCWEGGWHERYSGKGLIIYEKDGTLPIDSRPIQTPTGFRIPLRGRSSEAVIHYICDHYEDLADIVCLTKTHVDRQYIAIHESIENSHKFDHFEFWNDCRVFVWIHPEKYEHFTKDKKLIDEGWCLTSHHHSIDQLGLGKYVNESSGGWPSQYENRTKFLIKADRWLPRLNPLQPFPGAGCRLRSVWSDWDIPEVYLGRQENVWSVKKEVILQHPKELYEEMRDVNYYLDPSISNLDFTWALNHDQWSQFWPLFWNETIRRMKNVS